MSEVPISSIIAILANYLIGILLLPGFFSPVILYFWYIKRGGAKWLILPAATLPLLFFVGLVTGYFVIFSLVYVFLIPFVCYFI